LHVASLLQRRRASTITSNRQARFSEREITAYQLTSMMEGVVIRGTAERDQPARCRRVGKTGTNDEKDADSSASRPTSWRLPSAFA
jgi:penicillin-binding protein 1A